MNKPQLKIAEWKIFDGKELIAYWETKVGAEIRSFVGRVKCVKPVLDQDTIMSLNMNMSVCFEIEIKEGETSPKPKSKKENLKIDFMDPGQMTHGMDTTVIYCFNGNLCISINPEEQQMFLDLEQEYTDNEKPNLKPTPPS